MNVADVLQQLHQIDEVVKQEIADETQRLAFLKDSCAYKDALEVVRDQNCRCRVGTFKDLVDLKFCNVFVYDEETELKLDCALLAGNPLTVWAAEREYHKLTNKGNKVQMFKELKEKLESRKPGRPPKRFAPKTY